MEKRVVVFLVVSLGIIFGWNLFLEKMGWMPPPTPVQEEQSGLPSGLPSSDQTSFPETSLGESNLSDLPPGSDPIVQEELALIETPLYRAQISNRGAEIRSWKLTEYLVQDTDEPEPIEFVYSEGHFAGPLALYVSDADLNKVLQESLYETSKDFDVLSERHPTGRLTYTFRDPNRGIVIQKVLTFHYDSYLVDVSIQTEGLTGDFDVVLGTNFGVVEWGEGFIGLIGPAWKIGEVLEKETPEPELERSGEVEWLALQDKYFISVLIPQGADGVVAKTELDKVVTARLQYRSEATAQEIALQMYAGPKKFKTLKELGHDLEDTIDFGWFIYGSWGIVKAVAKPLFHILLFLYDYTQNYGVAIILLTCGIKLLFVPLQYKSYKSMQGMQKVQPKVKALQDKLKDDREKLNRELIKLYKEHKVNPVGGCLPMLLQMPAFISLFNILYMTVDLRQAPFMLWVTDLSVPDPFYVLPILMGASMVIQQKIMPTTMDPMQAKMMLFLPVVLTFLFLTFPAGLVLYWLTNNTLTILQQFITDRFILKRHLDDPGKTEGQGPTGQQNGPDTSSKKKKS
ncbi:MAG: membrane protein insertase YidC [Nitrospirota bacterium]|nr:membrane protein insertase YidC [Nitrospirota bacterium]